MGFARSLSLAALALALSAPMAAASTPRLRLSDRGQAVSVQAGERVLNETDFPGFSCLGSHPVSLIANPSPALRFVTGEGGGEHPNAYYSCRYAPEYEEYEGEGFFAQLRAVAVTGTTVTETFHDGAGFADPETGCEWGLHRLSGVRPVSGGLEGIAVSGTADLRRRLLPHADCASRAPVTGTLTIEPGEGLGSQPPPLLVEELP